jgi:hypothetical protein
MKSPTTVWCVAALALAVLAGFALPARLAADELQGAPYGPEVILRWDPVGKTLLPIVPEQMKVGCIYNHFSQRLHRRVWSYLQADRQFWNAYGPGTVQEVTRLDLAAPLEERTKQLSTAEKDLVQEASSRGRTVFVKLDADNRWTFDHTAGILAVIYDVETGMRWERHHVCYIPVVHVCGDCWGYAADRYFPW